VRLEDLMAKEKFSGCLGSDCRMALARRAAVYGET
jgi:hypothetical protein